MCPDKVMPGTPLKRWTAQWLFVSFGGEREREREGPLKRLFDLTEILQPPPILKVKIYNPQITPCTIKLTYGCRSDMRNGSGPVTKLHF